MEKIYPVSEARNQLGDILSLCDNDTPVFIVKRGKRYRVQLERTKKPSALPKKLSSSPAIASGQWTWESVDGELTFKGL